MAKTTTLIVRWSRGSVQIDGCYRDDAPTGHPRFEDAKLVYGQWTWTNTLDGIRAAQEYAKDAKRHLLWTWGIEAHHEIWNNGRMVESK